MRRIALTLAVCELHRPNLDWTSDDVLCRELLIGKMMQSHLGMQKWIDRYII
jgi:hypothetical protein